MLGLATVDDMIAAPPAPKMAPAQVLESLEWWQTLAKFKRRSIDTKECDFINVSLCGEGSSEDFSDFSLQRLCLETVKMRSPTLVTGEVRASSTRVRLPSEGSERASKRAATSNIICDKASKIMHN